MSLREVHITKSKITVNVWSKSRGNQQWFELVQASSYRGFELMGVNCT